jgi:tetratricopeptide (TPR) repeat protein
MWVAIVYLNLGEWDAADSVARLSEQNQIRFGPVDKLLLGWMRAELNGDRQAASRIIKATTELTPSFGYATLLAMQALQLNRPREALKIFEQVDPASPEMEGRWTFWGNLTDAHHMLGEHDRELTAARRSRKQYPDVLHTLWFEARALAALDRVDDVSRLLDQAGNFTPGSASINDPGLTAGLLAMWSGLELLAHSDSTAAENAFARSVSWYQRLPEQQRNEQLMQYGEALYYSGAFTKAEEVFDRACSMTTNTPDCLGWAGVVKARLGKRDQALALREAIYRTDSTPRRRIGQQAYDQARISAAVGDREGAVEFLRRAFVHGFSHGARDHRYYDFHELLNYPPFMELIKPKD